LMTDKSVGGYDLPDLPLAAGPTGPTGPTGPSGATGPTGAPGSGIALETLYDCDLTAESAADFLGGDAAHVIGGKSWNAKHTNNASAFGLVPGTGLAITHNFVHAQLDGDEYSAPLVELPLPDVDARLYDARKGETWLWVRWAAPVEDFSGTIDGPLVGFQSLPFDVLRHFHYTVTLNRHGGAYFLMFKLTDVAGTENFNGRVGDAQALAINATEDVIVMRSVGRDIMIYRGTWAAGWPTRESLIPCATMRRGVLTYMGPISPIFIEGSEALNGGVLQKMGIVLAASFYDITRTAIFKAVRLQASFVG
jgi:hypothetical protein